MSPIKMMTRTARKSPARGLPPNFRSIDEYKKMIYEQAGQKGPAKLHFHVTRGGTRRKKRSAGTRRR
jgi:hypothetical protein